MTRKKQNRYEKFWKYEGSRFKSDAQWFSFLRSNLRKGWNTHFMKLEKLKQVKKKIPNPNPKSATRFPEVFGAGCEICGKTCALSAGKKEARNKDYIVIDHKNPAKNFSDISHVQGFFERLFCVTIDDLRAVCTTCNSTLAYADKHGISFEEAKLEKEAIDICKNKQDVQWLKDHGILPAKNATLRRKQLVEAMTKETKNV